MTRSRPSVRLWLAAALVLVLAGPIPAQTAPEAGPQRSPILTLDQDRLYADSRFGQRMLGQIDEELRALQAENRQIEADLETEERALTDRRASLPPEEFRALADAFDDKVQQIRAARDAKARDLAARRDAQQQRFLETAVPILAQIMQELSADAIVDRSVVILSFDRIDITDLAISRIDAALATEAAPAEGAPPEAAPEAPAPAPAD
jgi:Skp family chaperone for outer membrane proteins